ncbi:NAD(P)-binding protein [Coniophora puteana RWD-64-598 SS2]|uniref:NAD(P)-binding protein n=1 Tax=Coniophora puteana (strain RWD-64-598) TaxID=741705 RepID=A0A5M3MER3_CONPW|nr:NAD(P)-binding protein [Coniophora puteana RWD-64-598 SS2]EIW77712.1 NAD(P)-binding protein [Coniophora puteana RWD-64-598 SS2]
MMADTAPPPGSAPSHTARVAIVTGAAQGIGRAIALRLAEDGLDVAVADVAAQQARLDEVVLLVRAKGRRALAVATDVAVEREVEDLVRRAVDELGRLDVMVANAGQNLVGSIVDTPMSEWQRIFGINVYGTAHCYRAAANAMIAQGQGGRIIGATSVQGKTGAPLNGVYGATKAAIRSITQTLARELGPHGITVNTYAPGPIDTPFMHDAVEKIAKGLGAPSKEAFMGQFLQMCSVSRLGTPEDVAGVVSFLASKDSAYITGQSFNVDGGMLDT